MWCPNCQADVAAEVAADSQRVNCATCNTEIQVGTPARSEATTDAARELLKRWANDELADPFGPLPDVPTRSAELSAVDEIARPVDRPGFDPHFDPAGMHAVFPADDAPVSPRGLESMTAASINGSASTDSSSSTKTTHRQTAQPSADAPRVHSSHRSDVQAPHFHNSASATETTNEDIQSAVREDHGRGTSWMSFWGQILAYLGVAGVTVGTSMVLWGYFGGPDHYTPTGWLIVTAGQMMLFLGVVTLVSGGMEQTTDTVAKRIDRLGTRLLRIEQATREQTLRGPHTPAADFSETADSPRRRSSRAERQRA